MFPVYLKDAGFEPPDDPIHYLVTADGLFLVKENPVFRSCVRVRGIRGLQGQKDEVHWKLPLIPGGLLQRIVGLFREVYRRHKSEAIVLLLYDPATKEYELCVPEQYVAGGHLTYVPGPTPPGKIRVDGRRFPLTSRDVFEPVPRETAAEVWYEALTHIHAEPPPRDSLDGKPSAI
ncbi:MAG: hypothetical protein HYW08_12855 [candidate division NC10 bacterium]|nr:hypothetical protein [candidate division NC10 bacterium]